MENDQFIFDYCKYPVVPVKFYYKDKKTPFIEALLDSGGDFIVIPMPIAKYLGLKLKKAGFVDTAGGQISLFNAKVDITIGKRKKNKIYENHNVHISTRDDIPVLLGRNPVFEDFEIIFRKSKNQLILKPDFKK
jgi:hypothetical protein